MKAAYCSNARTPRICWTRFGDGTQRPLDVDIFATVPAVALKRARSHDQLFDRVDNLGTPVKRTRSAFVGITRNLDSPTIATAPVQDKIDFASLRAVPPPDVAIGMGQGQTSERVDVESFPSLGIVAHVPCRYRIAERCKGAVP